MNIIIIIISLIKEKKGDSLMNETNLTPLVIIPEGTNTSGKDLMPFKKENFLAYYQIACYF